MKAIISHVTTRASGKVVKRDHPVEAETLRIGRSPECEIHLDDPRLGMNHAVLHQRDGELIIDAEAQQGIKVNGNSTLSSPVKVGDVINVGPFELSIKAPVEGEGDAEVKVEVQLVEALSDIQSDLRSRSRLSLSDTALSKRGLSWAGFLAAMIFCLALPLAAFYGDQLPEPVKDLAGIRTMVEMKDRPDRFWNTGDLSSPHRFLADQCNSCHVEAFEMAPDSACASCHKEVEHHADPVKFPNSPVGEAMCQSCHKEHNGGSAPIFRNQFLCGDCHVDLDQRMTQTTLKNASDFSAHHPDVSPAVIVDSEGAVKRIPFAKLESTKEISNLKFPHDKHLTDKGVRGPEKVEFLGCGDCHTSEPGGVGMEPISQKDHCQRCHTMAFDAQMPDRALHHGDVKDILHVLDEFYADMALRQGFKKDAVEPVVPPQVNTRRRAGAEAAPVTQTRIRREGGFDADEALDWAKKKSMAARESVFGKQVCGACHEVIKPADSVTGDWDIRQVHIAERWMMPGTFDHSRHESLDCGSCHEAEKSKEATDILLPGIDNCRDCHGGEDAEFKVPNTCIDCHDLHIEGLPPMRKIEDRSAGMPKGHPPTDAG